MGAEKVQQRQFIEVNMHSRKKENQMNIFRNSKDK